MKANTFTTFKKKPLIGAIQSSIVTSLLLASSQTYAFAEDTQATEKEIEKISVVGSQIRGAAISEALAVSTTTLADIEAFGIDSGEELMSMMPENGMSFVNETGTSSGGVNAARGDVAAFNLRNLGTGNTLVLLNGRRLVNSATYQTELSGGSNVPVNAVNTNVIPIVGLAAVDVLRDGASAIYGADAVAGVVNHVLQSNFVGFDFKLKHANFDNFDSPSTTFSIKAGKDFNDGATNVSGFFSYHDRASISASDQPDRWLVDDLRERLPDDSPWKNDTSFRNNSTYTAFPRVLTLGEGDPEDYRFSDSNFYDGAIANGLVDSSGRFDTYPINDERCNNTNAWTISDEVCGIARGSESIIREGLNFQRDLRSDLTRANAFISINHDFANDIESFTELSYYKSTTTIRRHSNRTFNNQFSFHVPADAYYNPFGSISSPSRLPVSVAGDFSAEGYELIIDRYRFSQQPRIVDNDGETYRVLQGFRGLIGDWDWEAAVSHSKATKEDITKDRVSNSLLQKAIERTDEGAYNPFNAGIDSNIEQALVDVSRLSETKLSTFDVKFSNPDLYELPAGSVALLVGAEWRKESFKDDRDDRLDGTIKWTNYNGDTYPFVSDIANSSPTPDSDGSRQVYSLFTEIQIPVLDNLDVQAAIRYEDFNDINESTTVGKIAFGYRPFEQLLVRGSWSEAFRAPNLVTVNESIVARLSTPDDAVCRFAEDITGGNDDYDCEEGAQRIAQGSDQLKPEQSTNTSIGAVWTPTDNFSITLDYWSIVKDDSIGLLGEDNHTLLDLVLRLDSDCSVSNPAVERFAVTDEDKAFYEGSGMCAVGKIDKVFDSYTNLDTLTVKGHDLGVYYNIDTSFGIFDFKYNAAFLDKYEQASGGQAAEIIAAIPAGFEVAGFDSLIGKDGNQDKRHTARFSWTKDNLSISLIAIKVGSYYDSSKTLVNEGIETRYILPSMTTYNTSVSYKFNLPGAKSQIRFGIKNLTDERAPLFDNSLGFGFDEDAHSDYGRSYYVDIKASF
jgi:outer membrane receptor protein involved in Fe transport